MDFGYRLLNTHELEKIRGAKDLTSWPVLYTLSSIWNLNEEVVRKALEASERVCGSQERYKRMAELICNYIRKVNPQFTWNTFSKIESEVVTKEYRVLKPLQSTLDDAREEGIEQGIEKGMEKVVQSMLKDNADIRIICRYTGLSRKRVEELKRALES